MRFANAHRYYVMACAVMLGGLAIAAESISITATPRYPWNGKVDLKFTIDGTSGTKYDTSFTAKDVAGGTNLTMKTLYKSDGTAAKEQLQLGIYNVGFVDGWIDGGWMPCAWECEWCAKQSSIATCEMKGVRAD